MTTGRYPRRPALLRPTGALRTDRENNFFLGTIGFSLFIHVIVAAIFLHNPTSAIPRRPHTISVDLVMAPVANPQRGSAGASKKMAAPVAVPKQSPVPMKVAKDQTKEVKKTTTVKDDDIAAAIAKMKQHKAEQDELKDAQAAIAKMKKKTASVPQVAAPVGSASGTGDEAGGGIKIWIYEEFRSKWKLSKYQIKNQNLKVSLMIEYDKNGTLINSKFEWSGDRAFDDSIRKAFEIFSKEKLPATFLVGVKKNFEDKIILTPNELFEK